MCREFAVGDGAAHDLDTLLYAFLDELLFCFLTDMFVCKALRVTRLQRGPAWSVCAVGCAITPSKVLIDGSFVSPASIPHPLLRRRGDRFHRGRHASGTEVRAITYGCVCKP